jgi:hypothetical protein
MQLHDALAQISEIRSQMDRATVFRGYRSAAAAFSGLVAVAAAALPSAIIEDPLRHPRLYVIYWTAAAAVSLVVVGTEMAIRARRNRNTAQAHLTLQAAQQFMPSLVAGGLLAYILPAHAPESTWLLPGLWMILFSLGIFASRRILPREVFIPAGFYFVCGFAAILLSRHGFAFSPILMGIPFATGQCMTAAILYFRLERAAEAKP